MRSQREMMANVSHELRTPLARMRVALDLAAEGDAGTAREVMTDIEQDLGELEGLVDDVLTSMRLDMVAAPLHLEILDPAYVVERAAHRFRALGGGDRLHVQVPDGLPTIEGDPVLLRRVVDNLLDNARKYSEAGTRIDLRLGATEDRLCIEVEDRGVGIAAADLAHIFTPFFRADRSRQRGTGGVGLGLSLAHKIVEAHRGNLTATSTEGHGTILRIDLPATPTVSVSSERSAV
jgi:two-component system, OmpR family, sensor kinase